SRTVGKAFCLRPLIAALNDSRTPTSVNPRALSRGRVCAGARVPDLSAAYGSVRAPGHSSTGVSPCCGVVPRAETNSAIGSIDSTCAPVKTRQRVVPGTKSVGSQRRIVDRVITVPAIVEPAVPSCAPVAAAPCTHRPPVSGRSGILHPLLVFVLHGDVGNAVGGGTCRNLVYLGGNRVSHRPRAVGVATVEPHAVKAHVVHVP